MTNSSEAPAPQKRLFTKVSPQRRQEVLQDIAGGSDPRLMYYVLLGASVVIAAFGLLANSPAVVIGAMLVSPLMMPIFGISVGLSRGDGHLLRSALIAEFGGVALAIALGFLLGKLPLSFSVTSEMLARTSPNLLDLFVATFAGLAGCLAMIDERVSPALPGVAISTSLTPPLATSGLCLALGAYQGAWGAFLLFFANFLVILAVATVIFVSAGFVYKWELGSVASVTRRFASPAIGLLAVTILLTQQLLQLADDRETDSTIRAVLAETLRDDPSISIADVVYHRTENATEVLASVRSARVLSPKTVEEIEDRLVERLGTNVALFFRCLITKDVGAAGSANLLTRSGFGDSLVVSEESSAAQAVQATEQALRNILVDRPNIILEDVRSVKMPVGLVIVASIQTGTRPVALQVRRVEEAIRKQLGRDDISLLVRTVETTDTSSHGRVLLGATHFLKLTEAERQAARQLEADAKSELEQGGELFVTSIDAAKDGKQWQLRAEVVGPRIPAPARVKEVEELLASKTELPVNLSLWARTDVVVSDSGYDSVDRLIEASVRSRIATISPEGEVSFPEEEPAAEDIRP